VADRDPDDYAIRYPLRVGARLGLARQHVPEEVAEVGAVLWQLGVRLSWVVFPRKS
jgi:hypothetical protein